jgi:hypothetical protein
VGRGGFKLFLKEKNDWDRAEEEEGRVFYSPTALNKKAEADDALSSLHCLLNIPFRLTSQLLLSAISFGEGKTKENYGSSFLLISGSTHSLLLSSLSLSLLFPVGKDRNKASKFSYSTIWLDCKFVA